MPAAPDRQYGLTMDERLPSSVGAAPVGTIIGGLHDRLRRRGGRPAIVDSRGSHSSAEFARTYQRAAAGLISRGMQPNDVVATLAPVGAERFTAVCATITAGGVALPLDAGTPIQVLASVLIETDTRLLITAAPFTTLALRLAERSRVRQVISFEKTEETTPFDELTHGPRHSETYDPDHFLFSNGLVTYDPSTGTPSTRHRHSGLLELFVTLNSELLPRESDVVLVEPAIAEPELTVLTALALWHGARVAAAPSAEAAERLAAEHPVTVRGKPAIRRIS